MFKQNEILRFAGKLRPRFAKKYRVDESGCWLWTGAKRGDGYGVIKLQFAGMLKAHRLSWVIANGRDIQEGLVIDHLCGNKGCVNPAHLEEVTQAINVERYHDSRPDSGICKRGHSFDRGKPCPTCNREKQREWRERNPEAARIIQRRYDATRAARRKAA